MRKHATTQPNHETTTPRPRSHDSHTKVQQAGEIARMRGQPVWMNPSTSARSDVGRHWRKGWLRGDNRPDAPPIRKWGPWPAWDGDEHGRLR